MKIKIVHGPEEQEQAEAVFRVVRQLLPGSRKHESRIEDRRILYLTSKRSEREQRESS